MAEWLFDDHSSQMAIGFVGETGASQLLDDLAEEARRYRGVEQIISGRAMLLAGGFERRLQTCVRRRIGKVAGHVGNAIVEPFPELGIQLARRELTDLVAELLAEIFGSHLHVAD